MVNILLLLTLVADLGKQDELEDKKAYFIVLNEICPPTGSYLKTKPQLVVCLGEVTELLGGSLAGRSTSLAPLSVPSLCFLCMVVI